jgi:hypothetical protein
MSSPGTSAARTTLLPGGSDGRREVHTSKAAETRASVATKRTFLPRAQSPVRSSRLASSARCTRRETRTNQDSTSGSLQLEVHRTHLFVVFPLATFFVAVGLLLLPVVGPGLVPLP